MSILSGRMAGWGWRNRTPRLYIELQCRSTRSLPERARLYSARRGSIRGVMTSSGFAKGKAEEDTT